MRERRRHTRQTAGWRATCLIDEPELGTKEWRECWVLDLATNGLGVTMLHRNPSELLGRSILVEFPAMSQWVSVRLEGPITHVEEMAPELVRVGIEFVELVKRGASRRYGLRCHDRGGRPGRGTAPCRCTHLNLNAPTTGSAFEP